MKPIDLSPSLNPARYPAQDQARKRAKREGAAMCVYVAPPDAPQVLTPTVYNVWYVRRADEPAPEKATLFETVTPESE